jgi:hypothetical protein
VKYRTLTASMLFMALIFATFEFMRRKGRVQAQVPWHDD